MSSVIWTASLLAHRDAMLNLMLNQPASSSLPILSPSLSIVFPAFANATSMNRDPTPVGEDSDHGSMTGDESRGSTGQGSDVPNDDATAIPSAGIEEARSETDAIDVDSVPNEPAILSGPTDDDDESPPTLDAVRPDADAASNTGGTKIPPVDCWRPLLNYFEDIARTTIDCQTLDELIDALEQHLDSKQMVGAFTAIVKKETTGDLLFALDRVLSELRAYPNLPQACPLTDHYLHAPQIPLRGVSFPFTHPGSDLNHAIIHVTRKEISVAFFFNPGVE
ncbi:hypothetical protein C8R46DRAFT_1232011 [Mycena filopes]|nr:hypothetical protein C8R46DRAFT_1232011 [Mycena filopes]